MRMKMLTTYVQASISRNFLRAVTCIAFCCRAMAKTDEVDASECFQSPQNPILFDSIVLRSSGDRGYVVCFLQPLRADYYASIRLNLLELTGDCPTLLISEYSTLITEEIPESENFPSMNIQRPSDLKTLATVSCKDFGNFTGKVAFTSTPGRKLMIYFRTTGGRQTVGFEMTITSYCKSFHYRNNWTS
uniref:CUB domain-containing protein n=1 Tax=Schistocephalus solidus TaxID=70667 RepID=A0A0X3PTU5_SCHSO